MTPRSSCAVAATMTVSVALARWTGLAAVEPTVSPTQDVVRMHGLIDVGTNVRVSADNPRLPHYEVLSCANPANTRQMLAGVMTFQNGTYRTIFYRSTDGGDRWGQVLVADAASGDPTCVFAPDGAAYIVVLVGQPLKLFLYRSTDGGASWGSATEHQGADRAYLSVDDTTGPFRGSLYYLGVTSTRSLEASGTAPSGLDPGTMTGPALFVSRNSGATFSANVRIALRPAWALGVSNSVVLADGSLVALLGVSRDHATPFNIDRRPARSLMTVRSTAGGTAIREAVKVNDWYLDAVKDLGTNIAALALDRTDGPYAGRLYAVWPDNRSGRSQVLLSWSDSKGDSWSVPLVVDDDLSTTDPNAMPDATNLTVAVNRAGVVGVIWGDRREHADNLGWRFRFAASLDGGDTFTPSVRLASATNSYDRPVRYPFLSVPSRSAGPRQPLQMRVSVNGFFYSSGHTVGMTTDDAGRFHPMWCDNRTGVSQVWTASVGVAGSAVRNGAEDVANLEDVTHRIEASIDSIQYDPVQNRGELVVRIKNVSPDAIAGPLKMRVLGLSGQLGTPILAQDDQDRSGTITFGVEALQPNERSSGRTLRFSIAAHHQPIPGHDFVASQWQFLDMRLKVFGRRVNEK